MRAEQLAVEPSVRGEKRAADAQQHASRMVRPLEFGAVPDRLAALVRGQLPRDLDRLPAPSHTDRQALGLAFAQRHPDRFPAAELADPSRALREREEKAVAQADLVGGRVGVVR